MINYEHEALFRQDSVRKTLVITASGGAEISNSHIRAESFSFEQSICSDDQMIFGRCEASCLKVTVVNDPEVIPGSLVGQSLTVTIEPDGADENDDPLTLGSFKVESDVPSTDRAFREITAYDALYDIINADVTQWYLGFWEIRAKSTVKTLRDSFFTMLGITQETADLCNDALEIHSTLSGDSISGATILEAICEINGAFGKILPDGTFRYVLLGGETAVTPAANIRTDYEDFTCPVIDKVVIRTSEGGADVIEGDGNNIVYVNDNALVTDLNSDQLRVAAQNLLTQLADVQAYRPIESDVSGDPCIEAGDYVTVTSQATGRSATAYIMQRRLTGIQGMRDTWYAKGYPQRRANLNGLSRQISAATSKATAQEMVCHTLINGAAYAIGSRPVRIISLLFEATRSTTVEIWHEIQLDLTRDDPDEPAVVTVTYSYDGEELAYHPQETWNVDGKHLLALHQWIANPEAYQAHRWIVSLSIEGGTAAIDEGWLHTMLTGQGLMKTAEWDGQIMVEELLPPISMATIDIAELSDDLIVALTTPHAPSVTQTVGAAVIGMIKVDTNIAEAVGILMRQLVSDRVLEDDETERCLEDGDTLRETEEE